MGIANIGKNPWKSTRNSVEASSTNQKTRFSHPGDHPTPSRCPRNVSRAILKKLFFMTILIFGGRFLDFHLWRILNKWAKSLEIDQNFDRFQPIWSKSSKKSSRNGNSRQKLVQNIKTYRYRSNSEEVMMICQKPVFLYKKPVVRLRWLEGL